MPAAKSTTKATKKKAVSRRAKPAAKKRAPARRRTSASRMRAELQPVATLQPMAAPVRTMPELPALDLDELIMPAAVIKEKKETVVTSQGAASWNSRLSFYLGVFFGAIVVHVLIVAVLAVVSI